VSVALRGGIYKAADEAVPVIGRAVGNEVGALMLFQLVQAKKANLSHAKVDEEASAG
jgi:hypothetical protein